MTSESSGSIEAIWVKPAHGAPMRASNAIRLVVDRGIVGNAEQGGPRQVTLIHRERWSAAEAALGTTVNPSVRRANLLVRGISLAETAGRVLLVGDCRIRIGGETTPCEILDRAVPGLMAALQPAWGGGAYGEVLSDAEIVVGAPVRWESSGEADNG